MGFEIQFLVTAGIFTALGYVWGVKWAMKRAIKIAVDSLIEEGFIKTKVHPDGEVEILKPE